MRQAVAYREVMKKKGLIPLHSKLMIKLHKAAVGYVIQKKSIACFAQ